MLSSCGMSASCLLICLEQTSPSFASMTETVLDINQSTLRLNAYYKRFELRSNRYRRFTELSAITILTSLINRNLFDDIEYRKLKSFYHCECKIVDTDPEFNKIVMKKMQTTAGYSLIAVVILVMICDSLASIEDTDRELMMTNLPYGRGVDNDMQLSRILLIPQRMCHPKRNSELINSLLSLPKNMNSAGRK